MTLEKVGFFATIEGFNEYISHVKEMHNEHEKLAQSQHNVETTGARQSGMLQQAASDFKGLAVAVAAAAAGYLSLSALHGAVEETQTLGRETLVLMRVTGLSAEAASALRFALKEMGVDAGEAAAAFGIFDRNLINARDSLLQGKDVSTPFVESLKAMHVEVLTNTHELRPFEDVLLDVADRFKELGPGEESAARAMDIFGRSGKTLLPILLQGREGIQELEAEAKKMGLVLTQDNVDAIRRYTLAQRELSESWASLKLQIGLAVIPLLTDVSHWVKENIQDIKDLVRQVIEAGSNLGGDFVEGLRTIQDLLSWIPNNKGDVIAAIGLIGAAMLAAWGPESLAVAGLAGLITLLGKIKGSGLDLGPLGHIRGTEEQERSALQSERSQLLRDIDQIKTRLGVQPPGFESGTQPGGGSLRDRLLAQRGDVDVDVEKQRLIDLEARFTEVDNRIQELGGGLGQTANEAKKAETASAGLKEAHVSQGQAAKEAAEKDKELEKAIDDVKNGTLTYKDALKLGLSPAQAGAIDAYFAVKKAQEDAGEAAFNYERSVVAVAAAYQQSEDAAKRLVMAEAERAQKATEDAFSSLMGKPTREVAQLTLEMDRLQLAADETSQRLTPVIDGLKDMKDGLEAEKDALNDQKEALDAASEALDSQIKGVQARGLVIGAVGSGGPTQQQQDLAKANQEAAVAELQRQKDAIEAQAKAIDRQEKAIDKQEKSIDKQVTAAQRQIDAANKQVQAVAAQLKLEEDRKKILQDQFTLASQLLKTDAQRDAQARELIGMEADVTGVLAKAKQSLGLDFDTKIDDAKKEFATLKGEVAVLNDPDHMQSLIDKTFAAAGYIASLGKAASDAQKTLASLSQGQGPGWQPVTPGSQLIKPPNVGGGGILPPGAAPFASGGFTYGPTFGILSENARPELTLPLSDPARSRELLSMLPAATLAAITGRSGGLTFAPSINVTATDFDAAIQAAHTELDRRAALARTSARRAGSVISGSVG